MVASSSFVLEVSGHGWNCWSSLGIYRRLKTSRLITYVLLLCVQVEVLRIHIGEVAPAAQEFSSKKIHKNGVLLLRHRCRIYKGRLWFICLAKVASTSITEVPTGLLLGSIICSLPCYHLRRCGQWAQVGSLLLWKRQMKDPIAFSFSFQVLFCNLHVLKLICSSYRVLSANWIYSQFLCSLVYHVLKLTRRV